LGFSIPFHFWNRLVQATEGDHTAQRSRACRMTVQKTTVDWLRFRAKAEPRDILETLRPLYGDCGFGIKLQSMDKGILGFKRAAQIVMGDMPMGRMDFGGESQRDWVRVDLTGKACEWVQDWNALSEV
jgi:DNA relaxase NicK